MDSLPSLEGIVAGPRKRRQPVHNPDQNQERTEAMSLIRNSKSVPRFLWRAGAVAMAATTLAACTSTMISDSLDGIGYRQARFEQLSAMRDYRSCRDEGLELDRKARASGATGAYLASARVLEKCEAGLGPDADGIALDERMRAYALSIQNYFKGGDVERARDNFDRFRKRFPDHDFYYPDGTSFVLTMEALLGRKEKWTFGEFSALNINDSLKSEMRRVLYWKNQ
jgi:tetratricopeptide (TPR) repeat protein